MLADRVSMIIQSLNLRPGMCLCALVDEIENKAPEATLEEIALVLWQVRNIYELYRLGDRNQPKRDSLPHSFALQKCL
jgi:hypothetical protein